VAKSNNTRLYVQMSPSGSVVAGDTLTVSEFTVRNAVQDYSGNNNHAIINGTLNRAKPAGSDIALWSGFSGDNYIELDDPEIGIGDFSISGIFEKTSNGLGLFDMKTGEDIAKRIQLQISTNSTFNAYLSENSVSTSTVVSDGLHALTVTRKDGVAIAYIDGVEIGRANNTADLTIPNSKIVIGKHLHSSGYKKDHKSGLWSISKAAISPDQIRINHRDMLNKLKHKSILPAPVAALAHDSDRDQDWIATTNQEIHRLDGTCLVETLPVDPAVGNITSFVVDDGNIIVSGDADVSVNLRAKNLRETKVIREPRSESFELGEGDSSTTDFYLQYGWKPVRVFVNGTKQRVGPQDDYTVEFDGYRYFIRFTTAPGIFDIDVDAKESK